MSTALRNHIAGLTMEVSTRQGKRPYINFDNAATTPPFKEAIRLVNNFMPWYSSVHRGNGLKSRLSTELYEQARQIIGNFVGANPLEHTVIFGKNTTEALNKLSYRLGLSKKDVVLISHLEHHSNDLPWRRVASVKRIGITGYGAVDHDDFERLLHKYAGRIRLVALSGASNVTGHIPDIHWFARKAHEAGAQIVVDAAQLAAHRQICMKDLDDPEHLDYVAISGHKMYAPFGSGALVGRKDTFMQKAPEYRGGGTVRFVTSKSVDWALPPYSEETGSPNVIGAIAMARAAQLLEKLSQKAIARHEMDITAYAFSRLKEVPGLILYGGTKSVDTRLGVIPFNMQGISPHLVSAILGFEWGIGVRSGCFCAQPYVMSLLGIGSQSQQRLRHYLLHHKKNLAPGMVRVSFGFYNTPDEVDRLVLALAAIARGDYADYRMHTSARAYEPTYPTEKLSHYFTL